MTAPPLNRLRLAVAVLLLFASTSALTETPPDFRRPQVFVHPSIRISHFVGPLGDVSGWGVGMGLTQGAQFGGFAVAVTIDTDYFLTSQEPPTFNKGMQIGGVRAAFRYMIPFDDFRPFAELGYHYIGFISNTLVSVTGPGLSHHALSGGLGFRYTQPSPFYLELKADWDWIPGLEDSSLFSVSFSFGLRAIL